MRIFVCQHWPPFYDVHPNKHVRIHHLDLIKIFVFKNVSVANTIYASPRESPSTFLSQHSNFLSAHGNF